MLFSFFFYCVMWVNYLIFLNSFVCLFNGNINRFYLEEVALG